MKRLLFLALATVAVGVAVTANSALALENSPRQNRMRAYTAQYPWHGGYYHSAWGMPVSLVVPPTTECQAHWGWGVANTRTTRIWHQYWRNYPGPGQYDGRMFRPTPNWPSDTDQFGVYPVRGPW